MIELLCAGEWTAKDISQAIHLSEKEVQSHLEHIRRTLKGRFRLKPAECLACGFRFTKRKNIRSPSRCPLCKSEHIQDPIFYCKDSYDTR
jgi:predicted Zn-ribbon and HTH transcriptional regulator